LGERQAMFGASASYPGEDDEQGDEQGASFADFGQQQGRGAAVAAGGHPGGVGDAVVVGAGQQVARGQPDQLRRLRSCGRATASRVVAASAEVSLPVGVWVMVGPLGYL